MLPSDVLTESIACDKVSFLCVLGCRSGGDHILLLQPQTLQGEPTMVAACTALNLMSSCNASNCTSQGDEG